MSVLQDIANLRSIPIVVGDIYDPPLLGLDVFAGDGIVIIETPDGITINKTFPDAANGGEYPYRWWIRISQVIDFDIAGEVLGIRG